VNDGWSILLSMYVLAQTIGMMCICIALTVGYYNIELIVKEWVAGITWARLLLTIFLLPAFITVGLVGVLLLLFHEVWTCLDTPIFREESER